MTGLATQLTEIKERGAIAIRRDVLASTYNLNLRQMLAVEHLLTKTTLDIRTFERMWPDVTRRTLQRDLSGLLEKGLVRAEGDTSNLVYRLTKRGR